MQVVAPNGRVIGDVDNPGLLDYYRRNGYTLGDADPVEQGIAADIAEALPAESDHKPVWLAYAKSLAVPAELPAVEAMTKKQLIDYCAEKVAAQNPPPAPPQ